MLIYVNWGKNVPEERELFILFRPRLTPLIDLHGVILGQDSVVYVFNYFFLIYSYKKSRWKTERKGVTGSAWQLRGKRRAAIWKVEQKNNQF